MATLNVSGSFSSNISSSLSYACPPNNYNGFTAPYSYCQTNTGNTLMIFYVSLSDGLLYGIDVVLSGYPFPP